MKEYSFEKLECWQHARRLAVCTYQSTENFPEKEKYGLVSQMRRAAISVASNIAEEHLVKQPKIKHISVPLHMEAVLNY